MAVTLTGSGGLFTILGKIFHAQATLNTARGTTVITEVQDAITAIEALGDTVENTALTATLATSTDAWAENEALMQELSTLAENVLIKLVDDDANLQNATLENALAELIDQMEGSGGESNPDDDVDASVAAVSVAIGGSNVTDAVFIATATNGDGRNAENTLAETISVAVSSTDAPGALSITGQGEAPSLLHYEWPSGSGVSTTLTLTDASDSILLNGDFADEDDRTDVPDDWNLFVGTIGTTVKIGAVEVQTVTISGGPGSGDYTLTYTDANSNIYKTAPLDFNASGGSVQAALQALPGLGDVTVATTGTSPNFTHTITFTGVGGNVTQLTSEETFDTGSIAHATTTAGSTPAYSNKCVEFDSDGAELTELRQLITGSLEPRTVYAFCGRFYVDSYPAAGAMQVALVDGAGSAITDAQGGSNVISINPQSGGDLTETEWVAISGFFRTPATLPAAVYLRIRISTAISNTSSVFIDHCALVEATELYDGGPLVAGFAGATALDNADVWTITATNGREGAFQEWFRRNFDFPGTLLPSDSGGTETISDGLIA